MIRNLLWRCIARLVTIPAVTDRLIDRAERTRYTNITSKDGSSVYMERGWVFNPYGKDASGDPTPARWPRLPSVRVHHICRPDSDRHMHDHPWNARTVVLRGWYEEERRLSAVPVGVSYFPTFTDEGLVRAGFRRERGYTGRLLFGEFHRIRRVPDEGVWTLFFTWDKQGTWGFLVDGAKVPWRKYLGLESNS